MKFNLDNMKRFLLYLFFVIFFVGCKSNFEDGEALPPDEVNAVDVNKINYPYAKNTLDWSATYTVVLPCKDCTGIETFLSLEDDYTYILKQRYVNSEEQKDEIISNGSFSWNEAGNVIRLEDEPDDPLFRVEKLFLIPVDERGFDLRKEMGNNFKLLKQE